MPVHSVIPRFKPRCDNPLQRGLSFSATVRDLLTLTRLPTHHYSRNIDRSPDWLVA
jgi:hypothetical protein